MVAHVPHQMEWHLSFVHPFLSRLQRSPDSDGRFGNLGCMAYFNGQWLQLPWSPEWVPVNIMAKELVPILLSCAVWDRPISKKRVEFRCDNRNLVDAFTKGSSKEGMVMYLLRSLWFFTAVFDIDITASHTKYISRPPVQKQFKEIPSNEPTSIPNTNTNPTRSLQCNQIGHLLYFSTTFVKSSKPI